MKRSMLVSTVFALLLTTSSGSLVAQPAAGSHGSKCAHSDGEGNEGKIRQHMFADLNLSAAQQEQLKALHEETQAMRRNHMESVKTVRGKMKVELLKPDASQSVLYGYADELGDLHKQMSKGRCDHLLKLKKVLTPEQFSRLVDKEDRMGPERGFGPPPDSVKCQHKGQGCIHKGNEACPQKCPHMMGGSGGESHGPQQGGCQHKAPSVPE